MHTLPEAFKIKKIYQPSQKVQVEGNGLGVKLYNDCKLESSLNRNQLKTSEKTSYTKSWINQYGQVQNTTPLP